MINIDLKDIVEESSNNFTCLVDYITSRDTYKFEEKYTDDILRFKELFDTHIKKDRYKFYRVYSIFDIKRNNQKISENMIESLINIDLEYSIERFLYTKLIEYRHNKFNYLRIKKHLLK